MANVLAVRPSQMETEKSAQSGTLMFRRADVFGMVRKLIHYADGAIDLAAEDERFRDEEVQRARRRALVAIREGLKCLPIFENPATVCAIPYCEVEAALQARVHPSASGIEAAAAAETTEIGSVHESPTAESGDAQPQSGDSNARQ